MLGSRIATELKYLDATNKVNGDDRPAKRRKILIHSSPYLRCIQTAVAIGAGLREPESRPIRLPPSLRKGSILDNEIREEDEDEVPAPQLETRTPKPLLRMDCYLEEWRSAGYFEKSIPPAASVDLLAAAKEYLKKPAEEIKGADMASPPIDELAAIDWTEKTAEASSMPTHEKAGLRQQMSKRARHLSDIQKNSRPDRFRSTPTGYNAPIPTYALAPSDPIPIGFVAHARDACLDIDFDWDSTKHWGDGGVWDEEWGSMHRRVGVGLQKLTDYYAEDTEDDIVVILVSHQACCNALIRIMTGAPALHDIGLSSLTLATRRSESQPARPRSPTARRSSLDVGLAQEFEMKIIASTEHLRGGSNPLGLNSPRLGRSPAFASRRIVGADSPEGFSLGDPWRPQPVTRSYSHRSSEADQEPPKPDGLWRSGSVRQASVENAVVEEPATQLWNTAETTTNLPIRSASTKVMWGGDSIRRDRSPGKRRWTAVDRSP